MLAMMDLLYRGDLAGAQAGEEKLHRQIAEAFLLLDALQFVEQVGVGDKNGKWRLTHGRHPH